MQNVDVIVVLLALAPVLVAFFGLLEASVKLINTIIETRSSRKKSKKKRKKVQKNNRPL